MIFYTADPHFGYEPTLVWRPGFSTVEEMDEALIAAWNAVVSDEDTVYLIGDIGWNDGHVPGRTLARLKGRKHLIRGNSQLLGEEEVASVSVGYLYYLIFFALTLYVS